MVMNLVAAQCIKAKESERWQTGEKLFKDQTVLGESINCPEDVFLHKQMLPRANEHKN